MKNVKFRGFPRKKTNSAVNSAAQLPRQKPKFRGSAPKSAARGKRWALVMVMMILTMKVMMMLRMMMMMMVVRFERKNNNNDNCVMSWWSVGEGGEPSDVLYTG